MPTMCAVLTRRSWTQLSRVRIVRYSCLVAWVTLVASTSLLTAQQLRPKPAGQIFTYLKRLNTLCNVVYVAAHPDDENTRLLSWLANHRGVDATYLSLTRGDGGQNILGAEQGTSLGFIRTYELLAARRIDGAHQRFGNAVDFGYSRSAEETLRLWDSLSVVGDAVFCYRHLRPDIVICRFPKDTMAGHGHHAASSIIAHEAWKISGNAEAFPEQLTRVQPYQPRRLFFNAYRFGNRSTIRDNHIRMQVGHYNPLTGFGYGEVAGISRSIHRSQGAGTPSTAGTQPEYFELLAGDPVAADIFEGIDVSWNRVRRPDIEEAVANTILAFSFAEPNTILASLFRIRALIATLDDPFWRDRKLNDVDQLIALCMGLFAEVYTNQTHSLPGQTVQCTLRIVQRSGASLALLSAQWPDNTLSGPIALVHDSLHAIHHQFSVSADLPPTQPYWLKQEPVGNTFQLNDSALHTLAEAPPALMVSLTLQYGTDTLHLRVPVSTKKLDPLRGDIVQALRVLPPVSIEPTSPVGFVRGKGQVSVGLRLRSYAQDDNASLGVTVSSVGEVHKQVLGLKEGTDTILSVELNLPPEAKEVTFSVNSHGRHYDGGVHTIEYDHLPTLQMIIPARMRLLYDHWKVNVKRVGYVTGAGDMLPVLLRQYGLVVHELSDQDMESTNKLKGYDAIITGIRSVNTNPMMKRHLPVLHRYVQEGGTLIMQYNTLQELSTPAIGPFPITLSRQRVTEEDSPVEFLLPNHELLNTPNIITFDDFTGWVQERGLMFPSSWDSNYDAPLAFWDVGEEPLTSAVLHTVYGKGRYIYCSLSLFRQLPAGVSGAYKLLFNMLSAGKGKR